MSKKKYNAKLTQANPSLFYITPIAFIISVVPLIVFLKVVELTPIEITNWYGEPYYTDFFNYYKSQWLLVGTIFAIVFFLVYSLIHKLQLKKSFIYIPALAYAVLVILSTVLSEHKEVALRGFVARYEGMYALLCYVALFLLAFNMINSEKHIKFIFGALLMSASIIGLIGLFQFLGYDLFRTDFGKKLILPKSYHHVADSLQFRFELSNVFSTFSNPNYIGSYMVLVIPIAFVMFLYFKKWYLKLGLGLLTLILITSLLGSRSLAGIVGLAFSVFVGIILFLLRKPDFKRFIVVILTAVIVVAGFFGANKILKGELVEDIKTQYTALLGEETRIFDLKDIVFENNKVTIVTGTESLTIENRDNRLFFYGTDGSILEYDKSENEENAVTHVRFKEEKYKNFRIDIQGNIILFTNSNPYAKFQLKALDNAGFVLVGLNGHETDNIEKYESIGFIGREKFGSSRGYIWSRTLPLLKNAIIYGYGPDTYAIAFPQHDYIGKIRAYDTAQMIVDKPHNTYLQIATNTGVLSLIAVLILFGFYLIQSIRLYLKNMDKSLTSMAGVGIFLAVCGYLTAALANDSVVAIAPIFWVLLGLGFVCNRLERKKW